MHSPKEAVAYAMAVKAIMEYIDASDCNMEEGSLRIDANISVRHKGEKELRNKIEIKNMNSFHNYGNGHRSRRSNARSALYYAIPIRIDLIPRHLPVRPRQERDDPDALQRTGRRLPLFP